MLCPTPESKGRQHRPKSCKKQRGKKFTPPGPHLQPWQEGFKRTLCSFISLKGSSSQPPFSLQPCVPSTQEGKAKRQHQAGCPLVLPPPAQSCFVGFLFIFVVGFCIVLFTHNNLLASLPPVALSVQLQTLRRGDNKYNPGCYCCKQHSWRLPSHSPHGPSSPLANNSCNVTLRTMNANKTAQ